MLRLLFAALLAVSVAAASAANAAPKRITVTGEIIDT
jgi:hypothetical protein